MSRRRDRREHPQPQRPAREARDEAPPQSPAGRDAFLRQAALLVAIVVGVTFVAKLAGAANLGVALGIAQIAFALALVALLLRR